MVLRQIEWRPGLERRSVSTFPAENVFLVGAAVIEQIESYEFHTLHFQVHQRAADAANRRGERPGAGYDTSCFRVCVGSAPIGSPIEPRETPCFDRPLTSPAERLEILYFALKTVGAIFGFGGQEMGHHFRASLKRFFVLFLRRFITRGQR